MKSWIIKIGALLCFGAVTTVFGCTQVPLPEAESEAAVLYVKKCGGCHFAYHPKVMGPALWDVMITRMEPLMLRRGIVMTAPEREQILQYLSEHSVPKTNAAD